MGMLKATAGEVILRALNENGEDVSGVAATITCTHFRDGVSAGALSVAHPTPIGTAYRYPVLDSENDAGAMFFDAVSSDPSVVAVVVANDANGATIEAPLSSAMVQAYAELAVKQVLFFEERAAISGDQNFEPDSYGATLDAARQTYESDRAFHWTTARAAKLDQVPAEPVATLASVGSAEAEASLARAAAEATNAQIPASVIASKADVDAIEAGGGAALSAEDVAEAYTWRWPRSWRASRSPDMVAVKGGANGFAGDLMIDLSGRLEEENVLETIGTASISAGGPTIGDIRLHRSRKKALIPISGLDGVSAGAYLLTYRATTSDSQTYSVEAVLLVD